MLSVQFAYINKIEQCLSTIISARKKEFEIESTQAATEVELKTVRRIMDNNKEKSVRNIHHCGPNTPTDHKAFWAIRKLTDSEFRRKSSMLSAHMFFLERFVNKILGEEELEDDIMEENGIFLKNCLYFEQLYENTILHQVVLQNRKRSLSLIAQIQCCL